MMIQGKTYWNRTVGEPHENKFAKSKQWSFDLSIDEDTEKKLLAKGMRKTYIRNKDDERGNFLSFNRDAIKKDGSAGKPYEIVDDQGLPWDQSKLIGNGSVLNCIITMNEREYNGSKFLKPSCVKFQVYDLVTYEAKGTFPVKQAEAVDPTNSAETW